MTASLFRCGLFRPTSTRPASAFRKTASRLIPVFQRRRTAFNGGEQRLCTDPPVSSSLRSRSASIRSKTEFPCRRFFGLRISETANRSMFFSVRGFTSSQKSSLYGIMNAAERQSAKALLRRFVHHVPHPLKVFEVPNGVRFSPARLSLHPYPKTQKSFPSKGKLFKFMSSDVLQCPLMSCDVLRFLFNFRLPLIEEKEEIMRINACSQYIKGGFEPPFSGNPCNRVSYG